MFFVDIWKLKIRKLSVYIKENWEGEGRGEGAGGRVICGNSSQSSVSRISL